MQVFLLFANMMESLFIITEILLILFQFFSFITMHVGRIAEGNLPLYDNMNLIQKNLISKSILCDNFLVM